MNAMTWLGVFYLACCAVILAWLYVTSERRRPTPRRTKVHWPPPSPPSARCRCRERGHHNFKH